MKTHKNDYLYGKLTDKSVEQQKEEKVSYPT